MTIKTVMLGDFDKGDTEILSNIVHSYLQELDINPTSFAFHIEVEYTDDKEQISIETFLKPHIGMKNIEELKKEGVDLSQPYYEEEGGVLSVMKDLFNWDDTKKGADYWYNVAHCEYTSILPITNNEKDES